MNHRIVSATEWEKARLDLLAKEKELQRARDALSAARRDLPWTKVEKPYCFDGPEGEKSLGDLFGGRSQLVVYHFMFAPEWNDGCKGCSFWADGFDRSAVHLAHRDTTLVAVSRAPLAKLEAFQKRLGWSFPWLSSGRTDFNQDFRVSFDPGMKEPIYNYRPKSGDMSDLPGISVFYRDTAGGVFHTYSAFARGIDALNPTYQILDLLPKGRDEDGLAHPFTWLRHRDRYEAPANA